MIGSVHHITVAVVVCTILHPSQSKNDWTAGPEAVFMTGDERKQWKALRSDEAREEFEAEYWRRRDPTPGTPQNEFHERIKHRIATADRRFSLGQTRGSHTQRGRVFVLLGPAAAERIVSGPVDRTPKMDGGRLVMPPAAFDSREWHTWIYDREKTPDVVATVGRHSLEIAFVVEPARRDELQSASLLAAVRQKVAAASLVVR